MKENKYDNLEFFNQYKQMERSLKGLEAAGEWHEFRRMLPEFKSKKVLDLGCGFGWHCRHAIENGASEVIGVDISERMLECAKELTSSEKIKYIKTAIEDIEFLEGSFECVISSLAFHYIKDFRQLCAKVNKYLIPGGEFVFSVEHPVFTAEGRQEWKYDKEGKMFWPVDNYYIEGERCAVFLGEEIIKYHRTLTTYVKALIENGFEIVELVEPQPPKHMLQENNQLQDELRRPIMLIIKAKKKGNN